MESEIVLPSDQLLQASIRLSHLHLSFSELTRVAVAIGDCFTTDLASSQTTSARSETSS